MHKVPEPIIIKKYANRRLYNTDTSTYITLDELAQMIRDGRDFEVVDAKTGTDLTRGVLTQILFEEEGRGAAMLPVRFLRQLIGFYDSSLQSVMPHFLETMMDMLQQQQQRAQQQAQTMFGNFTPFQTVQSMQELQRQNLAHFQKMAGMFNPFLPTATPATNPNTTPTVPHLAPDVAKDQKIAQLTKQVAELTQALEKATKG